MTDRLRVIRKGVLPQVERVEWLGNRIWVYYVRDLDLSLRIGQIRVSGAVRWRFWSRHGERRRCKEMAAPEAHGRWLSRQGCRVPVAMCGHVVPG